MAVCVDCNLKIVQAIAIQQDTLGRTLNMLHADAEFALPFPIQLPRYAVRQFPVSGDLTLNNIKIDRSTIGVLNTGIITNLDSAVTALNEQGQSALGNGLANFTQAVIASELAPATKEQVIELLSTLSAEATAPPETRRRALLRPLLSEVATLVGGAAGLIALWEPVKALLEAAFN